MLQRLFLPPLTQACLSKNSGIGFLITLSTKIQGNAMSIRLAKRRLENRIKLFITNAVEFLSFNSEVESLVDLLNHKLDTPLSDEDYNNSHPSGFSKGLRKRRISMAGSYIRITKFHKPEDFEKRLEALKTMVDDSFHAKTTNMPLNTARVQIALIKEAIKAKEIRRKQLESIADFGQASFGQAPVIRNFLNKLHIIEVPEIDKPLKDLEMGWDDHVHDMYSEGRKTPTQLLLDAFVKGISELTVVYSGLDAKDSIQETIEAGNILGIKVNIGIEFSVGKSGERRHYIFIPPSFEESAELFNFFSQHHNVLTPFWKSLETNKERRKIIAQTILQRFNEVQLHKINAGYSPNSPYYLEELTMEELENTVGHGQISRIHIGELLYQKLKKVMYPRVLHLRAQAQAAKKRHDWGQYSEWELKNVLSKYESIRRRYEELAPEDLYHKYIDDKDVVDYESVFFEENDILPTLASLSGRIVLLNPFSLELNKSVINLLENCAYLTNVELFNSRDSIRRSPNDLLVYKKLLKLLNNGPLDELKSFFVNHGIKLPGHLDLEKIHNAIKVRHIIPLCGSDSTGRDPTIPGMGFIRESKVSKSIKKKFSKDHFKMPKPLAQLILNKGMVTSDDTNAADNILFLGKIGRTFKNKVGDEENIALPSIFNFYNYLNPNLKNLIMVGIGFSVAYSWIGLQYTLIWFGITFFRNVLVDLIAASGLDFGTWSRKKINFDNACQSLFWTGFSVPILGTVKSQFDVAWPWLQTGILFETTKFFFICLANGSYIATHNKIRNFDKKTIKINFFRTIIAWPFATIFSPIGNLLLIPSIVQAKMWSDIVGGFIEGSSKFWQRYNLRLRDFAEILPRLNSSRREKQLVAMLDILYIWSHQARGKTGLKKCLFPSLPNLRERCSFKKMKTDDCAETHKDHQRLIELFSDPSCMDDLNEYILKNYQEKEALFLTDLVGKNSEFFLRWLKHFKLKVNLPE